jgi:hypothetical protein
MDFCDCNERKGLIAFKENWLYTELIQIKQNWLLLSRFSGDKNWILGN